MSSTNRGAMRHADDYYATEGWAVRAVFPRILSVLPKWPSVLEPAAGEGAIVKELLDAGINANCIDAVEIDPTRAGSIVDRFASSCTAGVVSMVSVADYRDLAAQWVLDSNKRFDLIITNPPFSIALAYIQASLPLLSPGGTLCLLLRQGFAASRKRGPFMRQFPPSLHILERRPSFYVGSPPTAQPTLFGADEEDEHTGSSTDSADYAWFMWQRTDSLRFELEPPTCSVLECEAPVRRVA